MDGPLLFCGALLGRLPCGPRQATTARCCIADRDHGERRHRRVTDFRIAPCSGATYPPRSPDRAPWATSVSDTVDVVTAGRSALNDGDTSVPPIRPCSHRRLRDEVNRSGETRPVSQVWFVQHVAVAGGMPRPDHRCPVVPDVPAVTAGAHTVSGMASRSSCKQALGLSESLTVLLECPVKERAEPSPPEVSQLAYSTYMHVHTRVLRWAARSLAHWIVSPFVV